MADFGGADAEAFRAEAKDWLAANFPPSLAGVDVAMANATGSLTAPCASMRATSTPSSSCLAWLL